MASGVDRNGTMSWREREGKGPGKVPGSNPSYEEKLMGMDRKLRYQQARRLSEGMLEQCLKANEEVSKLLHTVSERAPSSAAHVHAVTQMVAEFTQVQTLLCMVALSVQELTDELRSRWEGETDEG